MPAKPILDTALVSQLCVKCGICCSGVLHPWALLEPDEPDFARSQGFDVFETETKEGLRQVFRLPCHHLKGTACGIYGQPRPNVCGGYFCTLARSLDEGKISLADADAKVAKAQTLVADIISELEPGEDITNAFLKVGKDQASIAGAGMPATPRLKLLIATLTMLFDRHFRPPEKAVLKRG